MKNALVFQQCETLCPQIIPALKHNKIEFEFVHAPDGVLKHLLEYKFDFIICCSDTADEAMDLVRWLKLSLAVPITTCLTVFTNKVEHRHHLESLSLGVAKLYDIAVSKNFEECFIESTTSLPSRILLVEDNLAIAKLLTHTLQTHDHQVVHHTSAKGAHDALLNEPFDLMVTDLLLEGNKTGQDLITFLKRQDLLERHIPTLVITGYSNPAVIVDLLSLGVADIAVKPIIPEEFLLRVERILKTKSFQNQLEIQSQKLLELSLTDSLTGAFNRRFMQDAFAQRMNDLERKNEPFSVLMIDLDDFKMLNDEKGHLVGDETLKLLVEIVQKEIRNVDSICRYGGEEFIVILSGCEKDEAIQKAEQLCKQIDQSTLATVSIGLSVYDKETNDLTLEDILHKVDAVMYQAKEQGKNQVCY